MIHDSYNLEFWSSFSSLTHITTNSVLDVGQPPIQPSDPHSSWPMACHASAQIHLNRGHQSQDVTSPGSMVEKKQRKMALRYRKVVTSINSPFAGTMIPPKILVPKVPRAAQHVEEAKAPTGSGRICAAVQMRNYFKRSDLLHTFFDGTFCVTYINFDACIMLGL